MYDPASIGQEYSLGHGDGITVEEDAKINVASTRFEHSEDVEVRVKSTDGSKLGPVSNVIFRTFDIQYDITDTQAFSRTKFSNPPLQ